jgi:predicted DsbA family dithiol-disulfide isomerase
MTAGAPDGQAGVRRAVQEEGGLTLSGQRPTIRLVADLVCPWCCIAFARVQRLLATRPAELVWHPFLLNPHLPTAGVARAYYLERKFGSVSQAKSAYRRGSGSRSPRSVSSPTPCWRTAWSCAPRPAAAWRRR